MNRWKIDRLLDLFREAGAIALRYYNDPKIEIKSDHTAVTCADREIEQFFTRKFDHPEQGTFLIGEESVDGRDQAYISTALKEECFVLDPIDGTAPYAANVQLWGVSLGLMRHGALVEGAIYSPVRDEAFFTCAGEIFRACKVQTDAPMVELFTPQKMQYTSAAPICVAQSAARNWEFNFPNQLFVWSGCVAVYDALLRGKVFGSIQHCKLWDLAGGLPLLKLAGFEVRYEDGRELGLDVVAGGNFHLDKNSQRWRQKGFVVIAPDLTGIDLIWSQVKKS